MGLTAEGEYQAGSSDDTRAPEYDKPVRPGSVAGQVCGAIAIVVLSTFLIIVSDFTEKLQR